MAQDTNLNVHDIIWHFSVTDPRLHSKGFTVYKVSCKSFSVKSPELLTEIVCWKRYNAFKTLHQYLTTLHKAHHISDPFPEFAKPRLFGRFTESVIEKRRESAIELLNFISSQPHLYKSSFFKEFLEEGRVQSDFNKRGSLLSSRSSNLNIISSGLIVENSKLDFVPTCPTANSHGELKIEECVLSVGKLDNEITEQTGNFMQEKSVLRGSISGRIMLEGTWNFPQVADEISLGSSTGDETIDTDDESVLTSSLPDTDLVCYDTTSQDCTMMAGDGSSRTISRNASWLQEGLNLCSVIGSEAEFSLALETASSILENFPANLSALAGSTDSIAGKSNGQGVCDSPRRMSQGSGSSKAECGRGDLDLSVELQMRSSSLGPGVITSSDRSQSPSYSQAQDKLHSGPVFWSYSEKSSSFGSDLSEDFEKTPGRKLTQKHTSRSLLKKLVSGNTVFHRPRSVTQQSVSTMSLGGKDDYIYRAANQICKAQNSEANGDFEVAFAYYKSGVGMLLHGVQVDTNKFRRDAVRRKTAKYLMKAEDLFNRHLTNENVGEPRWGTDNFLSPSLDPSFAFIRGSAKELRNFQVLATIDRVVLVRHKVTDETFVIKSILKSTLDIGSTQSVLPTSCPYMVSLHRFYETADSVFLLLQYASGGKLWTYIGDYLSSGRSSLAKWSMEKEAIQKNSQHLYSSTRLTATNNKDIQQDHIKFKNALKEDGINSTDYDQSLESNLEVHEQTLEIADALRFPMINKELSESCAVDELDRRSSQSKSLDGEEVDIADGSDGVVIQNISDLSDVLTCCHKILPLDRRLSSLSGDSAAIGEQDSSVISPTSLPEDGSFLSLLRQNETNCEAFSINSVDTEDTNHSFSICEKMCIIPSTECSSSPPHSNTSQISGLAVSHITTEEKVSVDKDSQASVDGDFSQNVANEFTLAVSSDDIIRKSKELLTQVEKVLAQTSDTTEESVNNSYEDNSDMKRLYHISSVSVEEKAKYEENRLCVDRTSNENSDKDSDSDLSDRYCLYPAENDLDEAKFINSSDTNANKTCLNSGEAESPVLKTVLKNGKMNRTHSFTSNSGLLFRHTSTPRKLSINRMNYKGIIRSASFEYDSRSPTRSRPRTVSDLLERLDSTNVDPAHIPESFIRKWMAQMVTAVSRLHSLGVVCRDLKPSNILLGDGGQVYLTYFCKLGHKDHGLDWDAKENLYAAPEVGSVNSYDRSCDWWSIGALLYELVVGRSLSECHPGGINSHTCLHIPIFVSNETRALLEGLLRHNPNERLGSGMAGSEEIKAHPFFAGVDWHALQYS